MGTENSKFKAQDLKTSQTPDETYCGDINILTHTVIEATTHRFCGACQKSSIEKQEIAN